MVLDDPTSSLDNNVTAKILTNISQRSPWNTKTYVISTRSFKMLEFVDRVIYMKKGQITFSGSFEEFQKTQDYENYLRQMEEEKKQQGVRN